MLILSDPCAQPVPSLLLTIVLFWSKGCQHIGELDFRLIQLIPIVLFQSNLIFICTGYSKQHNGEQLDCPEVQVTICVDKPTTNKKTTTTTKGYRLPCFLFIYTYVCLFYRSAVQAASLSACTDCDPGYYCPDTNMTDTGTLQCDAGFYCTQGSMEAAPVNETWGSECPRGVFISLD